MREKLKTTHSAIFEYWKDKCILENGEIAIEGSAPFEKSIPVISDLGEPCCCGCGKPVTKVYGYITYDKLLNDDIKRIWDFKEVKSALNRCHINPASNGGSDNPDNLFLMCEECHCLSPDTSEPKSFFRWVYKKRMELATIVDGFNISELAEDFINECEFQGKNYETVDISSLSGLFTHGGKVAQSSVLFNLVSSCEDK